MLEVALMLAVSTPTTGKSSLIAVDRVYTSRVGDAHALTKLADSVKGFPLADHESRPEALGMFVGF